MNLKPKRRYQNDPKVIDTIKYCMKLRLTEKETVEKLATIGYDISERTVRRIRKKIPKPQRPDILVEQRISEFFNESIDDLRNIKKEVVKVGKNDENPYVKLRAFNTIINILKTAAEFYDASPTIAALSKRVNDETIQKS